MDMRHPGVIHQPAKKSLVGFSIDGIVLATPNVDGGKQG